MKKNGCLGLYIRWTTAQLHREEGHCKDPYQPSIRECRWWFQFLCIFILIWGRFTFWLIFFKRGWNHQLGKWTCPNFFVLFPWGNLQRVRGASLWGNWDPSSSWIQRIRMGILQSQLFIICCICWNPASSSKLPYLFPRPFFGGEATLFCVGHTKNVKVKRNLRTLFPKSGSGRSGRWKNLWRKWKLRSTIPRRWKNVAWLWLDIPWSWERLREVRALVAKWEFTPIVRYMNHTKVVYLIVCIEYIYIYIIYLYIYIYLCI